MARPAARLSSPSDTTGDSARGTPRLSDRASAHSRAGGAHAPRVVNDFGATTHVEASACAAPAPDHQAAGPHRAGAAAQGDDAQYACPSGGLHTVGGVVSAR